MSRFKTTLISLALVTVTIIIASCSTQKNTARSRWWHAFNARYNTYYNGTLAYIDGSLEKESGNKDNYTEMIPLYTVSNKSSKELGKANFDKAIQKAEKAIARHSIKRRPEWTKNRKKTERDIEWLSRREYNPFIWKAWMLMGRSQFFEGQFDEAASTFAYMSRLFRTQPAIYGKARAWLAKCYVEEGWIYDAEDVIRNMKRDSLDWRAVKEWDYTYADYYVHTGQFEQAIPYMKKVIKHEMRRKQKAREWYLLGQLYAAVGNKQGAYQAFKHVIRQNPPYELEFNARISQTEVMASGGKAKQMIAKLRRMAASDNNKDYLDQVYYAIGNIYLSQKDTLHAVKAYEQGNAKATRSGIEKGVLLLHLGDLYWAQEKYSDARRCYGEAIGLLDKDRKDYEQLSERSKVLDELVPYTDAVHLQDSLQALAKMPEKERNEAIDRVIDALKKKEKEERKKQAEADAQQQQNQNGAIGSNNNLSNNGRNNTAEQQKNATWYFYNPMAVSQGKATFQQLWGKRQNVDNWQRANQTVVSNLAMGNTNELTDAQRDSIALAEQKQDSIDQIKDSAQNDPHKREYYLAQIPFTPEQVEASNKILEDGLHHAGVIFKDELDNLPLSEKYLRRLTDNYTDYEHMDEVYYHLYLLYSRLGQSDVAQSYVDKLKHDYPKSQWTILLSDPYFIENSKFGAQIEDSLYAATYDAFKKDRFAEVQSNTQISAQRFPLGANRDKFLFIGGLAKLNDGDATGCVKDMKEVVEKYPKSRISELAGMIVNGVQAGRKLHGGKFDIESIWTRRSNVLNDSDSIHAQKFSPDRLADFKVLLMYNPDSLNENKLLFEMARFNFTNFMVRNFDINIVDVDGYHQMQLSGFRSFDEAYQYARQLFSNKNLLAQMNKQVKPFIISDKNLQLIGTQYSYKDYEDFYSKHFAQLKVTSRYLLSEPAEVATPRERDLEEEIRSKAPTEDDLQEQNNNGNAQPEDGMTIPLEPEKTQNKQGNQPEESITVPVAEPQKEPEQNDNTFTLPDVQQQGKQLEQEDNDTYKVEQPAQHIQPASPQGNDEQYDLGTTPTKTQKEQPKPVTTETDKKQTTPKAMPTTKGAAKPAEKKPEPQYQEPQKPLDDTGIYFDDGFGTDNNTQQPTNNNKQNQDLNLDDEYYDLDGF